MDDHITIKIFELRKIKSKKRDRNSTREACMIIMSFATEVKLPVKDEREK